MAELRCAAELIEEIFYSTVLVQVSSHIPTPMFTCKSCGEEWSENYCPECGHTIDRALLQPPTIQQDATRQQRAKSHSLSTPLLNSTPFRERHLPNLEAKVFISHASEDKEEVAIPLSKLLIERGIRVWLDQWELTLGDSLWRSIEVALSQASFGIVILSPEYVRKHWPTSELDGLFSMETASRKVILPVLHRIRHDEITRCWPMISGRLSCSTDMGLDLVADQIVVAVHKATSNGDIQQPPEDILAYYRRRMLSACSRHDLRRLHYELEDFLRSFPAHPQARFLKDELISALRYEDKLAGRRDARSADDMPSSSIPEAKPLTKPSRHWSLRFTLTLLGFVGISYLIYWLLQFVL